MLYSLQKAITDRFNSVSGATLRALVTGLWEDIAPADVVLQTQKGQELENPPKPFITFSIISTGLEQDFCSNMFNPTVQFTIFGDANNKSSIGLLEIGRELLNLFGDELFSMDNGYTMIRNDTVNQRKIQDEDKMWQIIYEVLFIVEVDR